MVAPSGEGAIRCMRAALDEKNTMNVDYINTHGTSTPVGDSKELEAIRTVFGNKEFGDLPSIASTKSLTGHALGAAGSNEAVYSLIMMKDGFLSASLNIDDKDPSGEGLPILIERKDQEVITSMSNSFGFGGVNACLVFSKANL